MAWFPFKVNSADEFNPVLPFIWLAGVSGKHQEVD